MNDSRNDPGTHLASGDSSWRWANVMINNYGTPPVALVRGQGAVVWDEQGQEYLDLVAGIAVNALGHAHPRVVSAVGGQVALLGHTSNLAINHPALRLAERLVELLGGDGEGRPGRVFFCNSGAEANEAAFKLTRLTGRKRIVAAAGSFHGRTMGALALTGQPAKADPFRPLPGEVTFVPYGDATALREALSDDVAAVILEPIQGEAGVVVPPAGYLRAAQDGARAAGALFVLDEVQTGIGRCGDWFAHQVLDRSVASGPLQPDVVLAAKGLGGGLPMGAMVAFGPAARLFGPGSHGCTFGGNPICAAAGLAVLEVIAAEGLLERSRQLGAWMATQLSSVAGVSAVRGLGMLIGVVLARPRAKEVEAAARARGLLVNAAAPDVVRLAPPLILTDAQACSAVKRLAAAISVSMSDTVLVGSG